MALRGGGGGGLADKAVDEHTSLLVRSHDEEGALDLIGPNEDILHTRTSHEVRIYQSKYLNISKCPFFYGQINIQYQKHICTYLI